MKKRHVLFLFSALLALKETRSTILDFLSAKKIDEYYLIDESKNGLNEQLFRAVENNDVTNAQLALEQGACPDIYINFRGCTAPLHVAAQKGNIQMVKLLLAYKANPNMRGAYGMYPIVCAALSCNPEIIILLLDAGAYPDTYARMFAENHALYYMIEQEKIEIIEALLKAGSCIDESDIESASKLKDKKILNLLLNNKRSTINKFIGIIHKLKHTLYSI